MTKPRILIFTGNGKGKTTAAIGMAVRGSGHGMKTLIIQFIKHDSSTGEFVALQKLPGVEIVQTGLGFLPYKSDPEFIEHIREAQNGLKIASDSISSKKYQMIILDEVCTAVSRGLLNDENVIDIVNKANDLECLVLTGRGATESLIALADTVSEIRCIKHGFSSGLAAQKGVER